MLKVFLDESGTHDGSSAVVMAGYLIEAEVVPLLNAEWLAVLTQYDVEELHMKEFVPPHGAYAKWGEEKKRAFLESLISLIHKFTLIGVGASLQLDPNLRKTQLHAHKKAPELVESLYAFCLRACVIRAAAFADSRNDDDGAVIDYILDRGCADRHHAEKGFTNAKLDDEVGGKLRLGSIAFEDSQLLPALQCADLLAYEMYKEVDREIRNSSRPPRGSFLALWRDSDQLMTIDPDTAKRQVSRGAAAITAIISFLPPVEKFQVWCYGLRSLSEDQRLAIFGVIPEFQKIYAMCLASGEMGKRLADLPPDAMPPDDPDLLMPELELLTDWFNGKAVEEEPE
ncbi:Protein of unknown function [Granulicella pectinivorans]|uniref:DUF3800 domain-containing protein n=1 Tax=Granulicella pectinivorans TaxID=474950 RepID=A0A1I6LVZ3_9BACT|nr:DUF3800 domain-containing protein [Granulicella pectinivorans]SFS07594.1 Protein of unknown function [Granulicella pectinivorans]